MENNLLLKTKIVCSIGPASSSDEVIRDMILAGMNVARFNFSHGTHESHKILMDKVKRISAELGKPVAIMLDTKGPEIRTGLVASPEGKASAAGDGEGIGTVHFEAGASVLVDSKGGFTTPGHISISWEDAARKVKPGIKILIADGLLALEVLSTDGETITCRAANTADIGSKKNVNLVGMHAGLPIIGEQDKADLLFGIEQDIDFVAASFLSFPREVTVIREFLKEHGFSCKIIAKIESGEGVDNIEKIVEIADGVMVARGDLAVQIPDEEIPIVQKRIIELSRRRSKPVITATQMLDSMIVNPRPTRAELTDVANAVFDGTDAVMLSGETASGAYPVESVRTMARIAAEVESSEEFRRHGRHFVDWAEPANYTPLLSEVISLEAYETANKTEAAAIVTPTLSGNTARLVSKYRPSQPILAITPSERAIRAMCLNWGVFPHITEKVDTSDEMVENAERIVTETGFAKAGDKVVLAAGFPIESPLPLNTVRVLITGKVVTRGRWGGFGDKTKPRASGKLIHAASPDEAVKALAGGGGDVILVCPILSEDYLPILKKVRGVVSEEPYDIDEDSLYAVNHTLVWLAGVKPASLQFAQDNTDETVVTIDGKTLLVFRGEV
jgi:pyruvate kinase